MIAGLILGSFLGTIFALLSWLALGFSGLQAFGIYFLVSLSCVGIVIAMRLRDEEAKPRHLGHGTHDLLRESR